MLKCFCFHQLISSEFYFFRVPFLRFAVFETTPNALSKKGKIRNEWNSSQFNMHVITESFSNTILGQKT